MGLFRDKVHARRPGILTYGMTPPRAAHDRDKLRAIADRQRAQLAALPVDAVVLYDLQDESSRDASPRPFSFLPTLDPYDYLRDYLGDPSRELIVYRAVANHEEAELSAWLKAADRDSTPAAVTLVGSPARGALPSARLTLQRAYALHAAHCQRLLLGGICIAERHASKRNEHLRILHKQALGCSFFVSQAVYDAEASSVMIHDLAREASARGVEPVPLLLTITPCGSEKALQFMKWLGIAFAPGVERRLLSSADMLQESVTHCQDLIRTVARQRLGAIPLGINVESVSIRRADIDAAAALVAFARHELGE